MSFGKQFILAGGLALALAVAPLGSSGAGTSTAALTVGATVISNCQVSTSGLTFANYTSGQSENSDTTTTLAYSGCSNQSLKFELNEGNNAQGSSRGLRSSGGSILNYQLYRNSSYNSLIGTGSSAVSFTAPSSGTGTVTVYGRIPASQSVTPGSYSDTVGVTLTF